MIRTYRGGFVAMGSGLSITNGVTREVRAMIIAREAADKERRKAYRKKPSDNPRLAKNFKPFVPPAHLDY